MAHESAKQAIRTELETAEAALRGAEESYADAQRKLIAAERASGIAYEGRARNHRNVDRLRKALAILEGEEKP